MTGLTILNFTHPLTGEHLDEIRRLTGREIEQVLDLPAQFDVDQPFVEQALALVAQAPLSPVAWQTTPLLVNLPALAPIAGIVLALISGRTGKLPSIVRMKSVRQGGITDFAVAEIIDLDEQRNDIARLDRQPGG